MPEEKVIHSPNCIYDPLTGRGNPCSCGAAADAGPRPSDMCGEPAASKWPDCSAPVPQEAAHHSKKCAEQLYSSMDAKCICGSDTVQATAPDWAMRVAEQILSDPWLALKCAFIKKMADDAVEKIAALIREAGSERERELREALRELADTNYVQCPNSDGVMKWVCLECSGNWTDTLAECQRMHSEPCPVAEAERLLGGESK